MGPAGADVDRFFHHLARTLADSDPARLRRPIPLAEIHQSLVPYRSHRRALGLASSDEYETVLLRLCAGEGDLVRVDPDTVRDRFAREAASAHPDLDILHQHGEVTITLSREAVMRALKPESPASPPLPGSPPHLPFAEPQADMLPGSAEPAFQPIAEAERDLLPADDIRREGRSPPDATLGSATAPSSRVDEGADERLSCAWCGGLLPAGRPAHFCPHCGQSLAQPRCRQCGAELERAWRHCVDCGAPVRSV